MSKPLRAPIGEVVTLSQDPRRILVVVEGSDDWRALESHFDDAVIVHPLPYGYGRLWVIQCIEELNKLKRRNAIGIADSDFGNILGKVVVPNVFYTDSHDLIIDILQSGVMRRVVAILVSIVKLEAYSKAHGLRRLTSMSGLSRMLEKKAIEDSARIGIVKLACYLVSQDMMAKGMAPIDISHYDIRKYIKGFLEFDVARLIASIKTDYATMGNDIDSKISQEVNKGHSKFDLANGKDTLCLIVNSISHFCLGNFRNNMKAVSSIIMSAFQLPDFKSTDLYQQLLNWANSRRRSVVKV